MVNILVIIFFVMLVLVLDASFILFIIPRIIFRIDKILRGELFLNIFEFFISAFALLLFTAFLLILISGAL